eukprot:20230-Heterococcus_DN1.PRE.2
MVAALQQSAHRAIRMRIQQDYRSAISLMHAHCWYWKWRNIELPVHYSILKDHAPNRYAPCTSCAPH